MRHGLYQILTFVGLELGDLLGAFEGLDDGASVGAFIIL